jgi:hypothetical protein
MTTQIRTEDDIKKEADSLFDHLQAVLKWEFVITGEYIHRFGMWTINDEIAHNVEELGEVRHAYRKEGFMPTLEESIDHWLTSGTLINILGCHSDRDPKEFETGLRLACFNVIKKLYTRLGWYTGK